MWLSTDQKLKHFIFTPWNKVVGTWNVHCTSCSRCYYTQHSWEMLHVALFTATPVVPSSFLLARPHVRSAGHSRSGGIQRHEGAVHEDRGRFPHRLLRDGQGQFRARRPIPSAHPASQRPVRQLVFFDNADWRRNILPGFTRMFAGLGPPRFGLLLQVINVTWAGLEWWKRH